jgi:hypothetical protein
MSFWPSSLDTVPNPYLIEFHALHEGYDSSSPMQRTAYVRAKHELRAKYSFAVPTKEALEAIAFFSPIVEPFAGTGYWAHLLRRAGVNVRATDLHVPDGTEHHNDCPRALPHTIVEQLDATSSVFKYNNRALFMCFPPAHGEAYAAAQEFEGRHVAYVGDEDWLLTGGLELRSLLTADFTKVRVIKLPSWRGENTTLSIWSRTNVPSKIG